MKKLNWVLGWLNAAFAIIDVGKVILTSDTDYFWLMFINVVAAAMCLKPEDYE